MISVIIPNQGYDQWLPEALGSIAGDVEVLVEHYDDHVSFARNRAIERAKGSHILCLDADDKLRPEFFRLVQESDNIVATGWQHFEGGSDSFIPRSVDISDFLQGNQIIITSLFPKKLYNDIKGFRPLEGYEDWDFWVRALRHGYKVEVVPEILVDVRIKPNSRNTTAINKHEELKALICA